MTENFRIGLIVAGAAWEVTGIVKIARAPIIFSTLDGGFQVATGEETRKFLNRIYSGLALIALGMCCLFVAALF